MKSKTVLKNLIFFLSIFLCMSLVLGLSSAYYAGTRKAKGSVMFNQGIHFDLTNVDGTTAEGSLLGTLQYYPEGSSNLANFEITGANAGQSFTIAAPQMNVKDGTKAFYARAKLNFNYFTGETSVATTDEIYKAIFKEMLTFNSRWIENEGYYYYTQENKYLNKENLQEISGAKTIDMFSSNIITLNDFAVVNGVGPFNITKIEIEIVLEVAEKAGIDGWNLPDPIVMEMNFSDFDGNVPGSATYWDYSPSSAYLSVHPEYKFSFKAWFNNPNTTDTTEIGMYNTDVIIIPPPGEEVPPESVTIPDYIIFEGTCYKVIKIIGGAFTDRSNLITTIGDISGTWIKESDGSIVDSGTLLKDIDYTIIRK